MANYGNELKQCTRCHSTILLEYFDVNRKGEFYKTCRKCLNRDHNTKALYTENNKEHIAELAKLKYENNKEHRSHMRHQYIQNNENYIYEPIICECGGRYLRNNKAIHTKSNKHQVYLDNQSEHV